jgi:hypothetical protein
MNEATKAKYSPEYLLIIEAREAVRKIGRALIAGFRDKQLKTEADGERYIQALESAKVRLERRRKTLMPQAWIRVYCQESA